MAESFWKSLTLDQKRKKVLNHCFWLREKLIFFFSGHFIWDILQARCLNTTGTAVSKLYIKKIKKQQNKFFQCVID